MTELPNLPLLHDGDSFVLYLEDISPSRVRLLRVIRYPNNENCDGVEEHFRDLDYETRHAIIRQINRRHIGKTILT